MCSYICSTKANATLFACGVAEEQEKPRRAAPSCGAARDGLGVKVSVWFENTVSPGTIPTMDGLPDGADSERAPRATGWERVFAVRYSEIKVFLDHGAAARSASCARSRRRMARLPAGSLAIRRLSRGWRRPVSSQRRGAYHDSRLHDGSV